MRTTPPEHAALLTRNDADGAARCLGAIIFRVDGRASGGGCTASSHHPGKPCDGSRVGARVCALLARRHADLSTTTVDLDGRGRRNTAATDRRGATTGRSSIAVRSRIRRIAPFLRCDATWNQQEANCDVEVARGPYRRPKQPAFRHVARLCNPALV